MIKKFLLIGLLPFFVFALDFKTVDDTEEGRKNAAKNPIAKDGKTIYRAYANIASPMQAKIVTPTPVNYVYIIGTEPPEPVDKPGAHKVDESVFLSQTEKAELENINTEQGAVSISEDAKNSPPIDLEDDRSVQESTKSD